MLTFLCEHLPNRAQISGRFVEPFVGGGAIYFCIQPQKALLADANDELIQLYKGIRSNPGRVWTIYRKYPKGKTSYKKVRAEDLTSLTLSQCAARSLYLNRTCFKGMWRHNLKGKFNVGYGGESRRWSIRRRDLFKISQLLSNASLRHSDFEPVIMGSRSGDYIFLDPPYRPGDKEQIHGHYVGRQFTFKDHQRLASCLHSADKNGIAWSMTISNHPAIAGLYKKFPLISIPRGTGRQIGELVSNSGEVLIGNSIM